MGLPETCISNISVWVASVTNDPVILPSKAYWSVDGKLDVLQGHKGTSE